MPRTTIRPAPLVWKRTEMPVFPVTGDERSFTVPAAFGVTVDGAVGVTAADAGDAPDVPAALVAVVVKV